MSDEAITAVRCHGCGDMVPLSFVSCPKCGTALMDCQRKTQQFKVAIEYARGGIKLIKRLERDGTTTGVALAARGRLLVALFQHWAVRMPESVERSTQIKEFADWHKQTESFLAGER